MKRRRVKRSDGRRDGRVKKRNTMVKGEGVCNERECREDGGKITS